MAAMRRSTTLEASSRYSRVHATVTYSSSISSGFPLPLPSLPSSTSFFPPLGPSRQQCNLLARISITTSAYAEPRKGGDGSPTTKPTASICVRHQRCGIAVHRQLKGHRRLRRDDRPRRRWDSQGRMQLMKKHNSSTPSQDHQLQRQPQTSRTKDEKHTRPAGSKFEASRMAPSCQVPPQQQAQQTKPLIARSHGGRLPGGPPRPHPAGDGAPPPQPQRRQQSLGVEEQVAYT